MPRRTRSRRWSLSLSFALLLLGSTGCGDDDVDTSASPRSAGDPITTDAAGPTTTAATDPETYVVGVDNDGSGGFPATYEYFFPDELTVHPGATIDFRMDSSSGEPHNVALGTTVDGAREAIDALPPQDTTISPGMPLPVAPELQAQFARMPQALPPDQASTADTMRLLQPCFIEEGDPPLDEPCGPDQRSSDQPFDGTQSFVSSQVMIDDGDNFEVTLADTIDPASYTYICTLHPSYMFGTIDVVAEGEPADTPSDVTARGDAAIDELNEQYAPVAEALAAQTGTEVDAGALGGEDNNRPEITINVFPAEIDAAVDEPVTWEVVGAHMFTFSPPEDRELFRVMEEVDGIVQPLDWQPDTPSEGRKGMPPFPEIAAAMVAQEPIEIDDGSVALDEFSHSGLLFGSFGPLPPTNYTLRFDDPGSYSYYCTRHPGMVGTVSVAG